MNRTVILGLAAFHPDSAACVLIDGELKAAVSEERLGIRMKHDASFPKNAVRWCLEKAGVKPGDITHIAEARDSHANMGAKVKYVLTHPLSSVGAVVQHLKRRTRDAGITELIAAACNCPVSEIKAEIVSVEHHLAHIASAYYCSPFENASALSYDGSGDFVSMMAAKCEGTKITILDRVYLPDSLGFFYSAICQFIGFDGFGEEYKVMGLAPYGEDKYHKEMERLLVLEEDGWFHLAPGYFGMHDGHTSALKTAQDFIKQPHFFTAKMEDLFGKPRNRKDPLTQRDKDLARSCQVRFEEAAVHCMKRLYKLAPNENFCMAGGSALNGVANARILRDTSFKTPYLQCAASDEGTGLGAALWAWHNVCGGTKRFRMTNAFWGPSYDEARIKADIAEKGCHAERFEDGELFARIVSLLREGKVVGWYQGASEWGPRALGNRSILADPTNPDMKAIINAKIKRRESFRPFAPSVLAENVKDYFEQDVYSPFMMHVVRFKEEWRAKLPAVTHVDFTGRLQSVSREFNQRYYDLIAAFKKESGVGILLNTSFNENEPVVDTPAQALECYLRTDMDALCLGQWLLVKE